MLDGQATDVLEGSSLSFQSEYIDIYSNCWGPKDDGKTFGKPGKLAQEALMQGALKANYLFVLTSLSMKKFQVGYVKEELDPRVKLHP